jgi:hypothetical protein
MLVNFPPAVWAALSLMMVVAAAPTELAHRQSQVKIMALGDSITGSPVRSLISAAYNIGKTDPAKGLLARLPLAEAPTSRYQKHRLRRYISWTRLRLSI